MASRPSKLFRVVRDLWALCSSGRPIEVSRVFDECHSGIRSQPNTRKLKKCINGFFVTCETNSELIYLDRSKLLDFLLGQVVKRSRAEISLPLSELLNSFERITGLHRGFLCEVLGIEHVELDFSVLAAKLNSMTSFEVSKDEEEWCLVLQRAVKLPKRKGTKLEKILCATDPAQPPIVNVPKPTSVTKDAEACYVPASNVASLEAVPSPSVIQTVTEIPEKHPNPAVEVANETILPSHSLFRPELVTVHSGVQVVSKIPNAKKESKANRIERVTSQFKDFLEDISSKNRFVPLHVVRRFFNDLLAHENRGGYVLSIRDIPTFEHCSKLYGRVEELIKVFCWFNPITSLHELELAIVSSERVDGFESLCIGPIHKHPRVCDLFKPPEDIDSVPRITAYDIQNDLMQFINKSKRGSRHSLEEFLEFMCAKHFVQTAHQLCVRINSFPLAIQTNFRFRSAQRQSRERTQVAIEQEVSAVLQREISKLQRTLSTSDNDPLSIRREIANKDPVVILESIFKACAGHFSGRLRARVLDFMQLVTATPQLRHLFIMSVLEGAYGADKLLSEICEQSDLTPQSSGMQREDLFVKSPGELLKEVLRCLSCVPFPIDLRSLSRVEEQIIDHFKAPTFCSLGNGSFLHCLSSSAEANEALGGSLIGSQACQPHIKQVKSKVLSIISQLNPDNRQKEVVAKAVTAEFDVTSYEDIGCGKLEKVLMEAKFFESSSELAIVSYLTPVILNGSAESAQSQHAVSVGVLGHQSARDALACLRSAPLLEDLEQWSLWEMVYKPQFGPLIDFLQTKTCSVKGDSLHVLCTAPHKLLHINARSSIQDFSSAIDANNLDPISASGHLVSMIVKRGSVHEIPLQLLAEQVKASLEKTMSYEDEQNLETVSSFLYRCMIRIPLEICCRIAKELFVDPLRAVCSSSVVDSLPSHCANIEECRFMQSLGMQIGVTSWSDEFRKPNLAPLPMNKQVQVPVVPHEVSLQAVTTVEAIPTQALTPLLVATTEPATSKYVDKEVGRQDFDRRAIIESIRMDEFGVGIVLDEAQSKVAQKQRLREGRSLKRLSLELYSKDTHFVLELIQNADDNSYPPSLMSKESQEVPSLKFVISSGSITVLNNESGFSEQNTRAICDVGKSTKGTCRSGYIGQKGIGFKSVFRITNTPEIHSNGFHVKFDASTDPIGYILPHWIEPLEEESMKFSTQIVLPLKDNLQAATLAKKFHDVQPSLLLFLHRLRSITIEDQTSRNVRYMTRTDGHSGVVEIHHNHATDRWLVIRRELNTANKIKPDVAVTELALAFSLPPDMTSIPLAKDLPHQQVFAFLPLRSYGFRFVVQADFDLPSSREDVNADSAWNQWLREEIPSLFVAALSLIKEQPGVTELQAVALFLQFVPLEGELHDFFLPLSRQIVSRLKGTECLPTDPIQKLDADLLSLIEPSAEFDDDEVQTVEWKQPSQLLFVSEKYSFIRQYIPQPLLSATLNLQYLNATLLPSINSSMQQQLGIGNITSNHLREIALAMLRLYQKECVEADDTDCYDSDGEESEQCLSEKLRSCFVTWIAKWLACLHIIIECTNDVSCIEKLKTVPVIPLENGTFTSASDCSLFFPLADGEGRDSKTFSDLLKEVNVIASSLFEQEDDLTQSRVRRVLEMFGVKNLYPSDIIKHHILPVFTTGIWQKRTHEMISMYLIYIKECIDQKGADVTERDMIRLLKDCVVVVTNHGPKHPSKDVVHFSKHYKCDPDLQSNFPEVEWTVVSEAYLSRSHTVDSIFQWRNFFSKLGVKSCLAVKQVVDVALPEDSEILNLQDFRRLPPGPYTLNDWECEEFMNIVESLEQIESISDKQARMKTLAEILDKGWTNEYHKYVQAHIHGSSRCIIPVASSFKTSLATLPWLPSNSTNLSCALYRGCDLYYQSKRLCSLLHSHVPYVGVELKNSDFIQLLGIKQDVSATEILAYLREWCGASQKENKPFVTSIDHIATVYVYLKSESEKEAFAGESAINDAMQTEDLVFVPDQYEMDAEDCFVACKHIPGHFSSVHKLCWMDPTTVLYYKQKHNKVLNKILPRVLQLYYGATAKLSIQLQQVFAHFGVPTTPNVASLVALLKCISDESATPAPNDVKNFTSVVLYMAETYSDDVTTATFIRRSLQQACVFPTHDHKWVSLESPLLENDDKHIAKLFIDNDNVHFLQWPQELSAKSKSSRQRIENRDAFLQMCHIRKLTTAVHPRIDKDFGETRPVDELKEKLHHYVNLIQCFLYTHCKTQYNKLTTQQLGIALNRLQLLSRLKLECRYVITHECGEIMSSVASQVSSEYVDNEDPPVIYISAAKIKLFALLPALMKLFMKDGLDDEKHAFNEFLQDLTINEPTSEETEGFFKKHDLVALPDEDVVWVVPLPVSKKQSPAAEREEDQTEADSETEEESDSAEQEVQSTGQLKSWPPKAAVNLSDDGQLKAKQSPVTSKQEPSASANIVTAEDVQQSRKKHFGVHVSHDASPSPSLETKVETNTTHTETSSQKNVVHKQAELTNHEARNVPASQPVDTTGKRTQINPQDLQHSTVTLEDIQSFVESTELTMKLIPDDELESQTITGRWGEEFVYEILRAKGCLPDGRKVDSISWVNEREESGNPFDIKVEVGSEQIFIEVKSTSSDAEEMVAISLNELKFAQQERKNFYLYRVYNAGKSSHRLAFLGNVYEYFEKNGVRFFFKL